MDTLQSILTSSAVKFFGWTSAAIYIGGKYAKYKWSNLLTERGRELAARQK
jgi:hypothetical protein